MAAALLPPADEILKWHTGPQGLQEADVAWLLWRSLDGLRGSLAHRQQTVALSHVVEAPWERLKRYQEHVWDVSLGNPAGACRLASPQFRAGSYDWQLVLDFSPSARHAHVAVQVCGSQGLPAGERVLAASRVTVLSARHFESSLFFPVDLREFSQCGQLEPCLGGISGGHAAYGGRVVSFPLWHVCAPNRGFLSEGSLKVKVELLCC